MKSFLFLIFAVLAIAKADLVISEIDLVNNKVEIVNTGPGSQNLTGYWFCNLWKGSPVYVPIAAADIVAAQSSSATLTLPAGGWLTLQSTGAFITDAQGEIGLYTTNANFGVAANMVDYVAWGGDSQGRDTVAASKVPPIWASASFVTVAGITAGQTIQLGAGLSGNQASHYSLAASTVGVNQVAPAPSAVTGTASAITATGATLAGTVDANDASTTVTFEYGETLSYGSSIAATPSPVTGTTDTAVSATLSSLAPSTLYNFRVSATSANGTTKGANQTFTTPGPPTVVSSTSTAVTATGATLGGTVRANGSDTTVAIEYGETISYGTSVAAAPSPVTGNANTAVSAAITGLTAGTTYHFRLVATNAADTIPGSDQTFTTTAAPLAVTGTASGITSTGASVAATVNARGASTTVTFEYGETTSYGSSIAATPSPLTGSSSTAVSAALTGLTPGTPYHFRVVATNVNGTVPGTDATFTTTQVPVVTDLPVTAVSRTGNTLTVIFKGPPNVAPATWLVKGSATLASFPDNKTAATTISETPAGSGIYQALVNVAGEPPSYFIRIELQ